MADTEPREWTYRYFQGAGYLLAVFGIPFYLAVGLTFLAGGVYLLFLKVDWLQVLVSIFSVVFGGGCLYMFVWLLRMAGSDFTSGGLTVRLTDDGLHAPKGRWDRQAEFVPFASVQACWYESIHGELPDDTKWFILLVLHTPAGQWRILKKKMPSEAAFFELGRLIRVRLPQLCGEPTDPLPVLQWGQEYEVQPRRDPFRQFRAIRGKNGSKTTQGPADGAPRESG